MLGNFKKVHWYLIALSILILVGTVGITAYLLFSNYQNVRLFKQAQENFLRGDDASLALAETQLLQLIRNDSDNEAAYIMLGAIAGKKKIYPEQVYYCYMAHRLNPLSAENKEQYITSLWYARYFDRLENFLAQQSDIQDKHIPLLLYAAGRNGSFNKYKQHIEKFRNDKYAGFLAYVLFSGKYPDAEKKIAALDTIAADDFIRQEILAAKSEIYLAQSDIDNAEKVLRDAYELNLYAFAPALGRFYANFRSLKLALTIFESHLAVYHDPAIALQTAEIYCMLGRSAEITELRNQYQADSGSNAMLLCYYFDAMNALISNDMDSLYELLIPLRKNLKTPLALFMFFRVELHKNNLSGILDSYSALAAFRGGMALKQRADDLLSAYLKSNLSAILGKKEQVIPLAKLLYERKPEAFTAKLILLAQKRSGAGDILLLQDALKRFPQDQGVLKLAIEYYLEHDLTECGKLIKDYRQNFPQRAADMLRYEIMFASKKKDFDRVSALFQQNLSPDLIAEYWNFAASTMREKDLIFLSRDPHYAPFCQALLFLKKGDKKAACNLLEKADARGNWNLLFFAAITLAENGRNKSALEKYALFPENTPYQLNVLMNKAELLAEEGNLPQALELAQKAYQLAPELPESQLCYADKLYRANSLVQIPDVIKLKTASAYRKRMEFLWVEGMQYRIKNCDLTSQREKARELCRQLLVVAPDNHIARECLKNLDKTPK